MKKLLFFSIVLILIGSIGMFFTHNQVAGTSKDNYQYEKTLNKGLYKNANVSGNVDTGNAEIIYAEQPEYISFNASTDIGEVE